MHIRSNCSPDFDTARLPLDNDLPRVDLRALDSSKEISSLPETCLAKLTSVMEMNIDMMIIYCGTKQRTPKANVFPNDSDFIFP